MLIFVIILCSLVLPSYNNRLHNFLLLCSCVSKESGIIKKKHFAKKRANTGNNTTVLCSEQLYSYYSVSLLLVLRNNITSRKKPETFRPRADKFRSSDNSNICSVFSFLFTTDVFYF